MQDSLPQLSPEALSRYSRHIILPQVGLEGQRKLKQARVLIIGVGGLGSPVSLYLAAAGVGTLGLADFDKVELHNLQRQIIHHTADVGRPKIDSGKDKLLAINPDLKIEDHREGITLENAVELISRYDIVVDGSDNFPTRYLVNDAAFMAQRPLVYGSIFQFEGQVSVFHPADGAPCYRCLFPQMPAPGTVPNCEEAGVFGALCGTIGSLQAMEAIKTILGIGESLKGRLLVVDALTMRFRTLNIKRDADCPLCGSKPTITSLSPENYDFTCEVPENTSSSTTMSTQNEAPLEIDVHAAKALLDSANPPVILDVREDFEVDIAQIKGSTHIPMAKIPEQLEKLPKDRHIVVQCHHGGRSMRVTQFLRGNGFENVTNLGGGIDAWAREIEPGMNRY